MSRGELFDPLFGAAAVGPALSDRAWITALLDVEAALARAEADLGVIESGHAAAIDAAAKELAERTDPAELGRAAMAGGNPVIPLVGQLRAACESAGVPAAAVHKGATSQDILDTALMLLARRAGVLVVTDLRAAADAAAALARAHRDTLMAARTLGQQALPTTFGTLAATWCAGLDRAAGRLTAVLAELPVQFGGAAGTLAALHPNGLAVAAELATELGLADQGLPWHAERTRIGELAAALGVAAGAIAKTTTDIIALAASEVGEVSEDSPAAPRPCHTSATRSPRSPLGRLLAGCPDWSPTPSGRWITNCSAAPVPGTPNGRRQPTCCGSPVVPLIAWRRA